MTPLEIEIILHYHVSPNDFPNMDTPAFNSAMIGLIKAGILKENTEPGIRGAKYTNVEDATSAYVNALCAVPLPTQKWIIEPNKF